MIFKYGSYSHADNEVALSVSKTPEYTARGFRFGTRERWVLRGKIQANTVAALTTAMDALEDAYAENNKTAVLLLSDGSTETQHKMAASDCLGGVHVVGLDYDEGVNAEYTSYRSYTITLEGLRTDKEQTILEYSESITLQGSGGPRRVILETLDTPPIIQITAQRTAQTIVQAGFARTYDHWLIPQPLLPSLEQEHLRIIENIDPESFRGTLRAFPVRWQFTFVSDVPQYMTPTAI